MVIENMVSLHQFISIYQALFNLNFQCGLDKISRQMAGEDNVLRTKILQEVNEDFHQGDKLNAALESDILSELVRCFEEEDATIRELASRAVIKVAGTKMGREILIEDEIVPRIRELFNDEEV